MDPCTRVIARPQEIKQAILTFYYTTHMYFFQSKIAFKGVSTATFPLEVFSLQLIY